MWEKFKLSEVCEIIAGQSPASKYYNQNGEGLPFFQGKADFGYETPKVRYWCSQPTKIALPNDILLSVRAPVGPTNICDVNSCIGRGLASIRVGSRVNYRYLYWWFKSYEPTLARMGNGSTFSAVTTKEVKELELPLPPLHIQEQIADTLDKADALRKKDQKLLKKYDELAQSIFYDMFGDPTKNEKGWPVYELQELSNRIVVGHVGPTSVGYTESDGVPFLRTQNVRDGFINYDNITTITHAFHAQLKKSVIHTGDVLISRVGVNRGMAAAVPAELNNANCANIIIVGKSEHINSLFLSYYLNQTFGKSADFGYSVGSAQGVVNTSMVKKWKTFLPSEKNQKKFADILENIHEQKKATESTLRKSFDFFKQLSLLFFS